MLVKKSQPTNPTTPAAVASSSQAAGSAFMRKRSLIAASRLHRPLAVPRLVRRRSLPLRLGQQAFALRLLPGELVGPANGIRPFAYAPLRRLLVAPAGLHLAEDTLPLHLLLEDPEGLIDVVVPDENLHAVSLPARAGARAMRAAVAADLEGRP